MKLICPNCKYKFDSHASIDGSDAIPTIGSVSVCINCAAILEFDNDLNLIKARRDTLEGILSDRNLSRLISITVQQIKKLNNEKIN